MTGGNRSRRSSAVPGTASRHYDNMEEEQSHGAVNQVHGQTVRWVAPNCQFMDLRSGFIELKGYAAF
jgi:hypothetical protein